MNIALPALIVFLLVIPGFIARSQLKLVESQSIDYSPFGRVVAQALIWAIALHAIWIFLLGLRGAGIFADFEERELAPEVLLGLLASNAPAQTTSIQHLSSQWKEVSLYFLSMYLTAFLLPLLIRWVVIQLRLDRKGCITAPLFRFPTPWYYLFKGADFSKQDKPDLVYVSAVVSIAGSAYLYVGLLYDWQFDKDGALSWLTLEDVSRRPLSADKNVELSLVAREGVVQKASVEDAGVQEAQEQGALDVEKGTVEAEPQAKDVSSADGASVGASSSNGTDRFYKIDGHRFILPYEQVSSLNILYVKFSELTIEQ